MTKIKAISRFSRLLSPECVARAMPVMYIGLPKVFYIPTILWIKAEFWKTHTHTQNILFFRLFSEIGLIQKGSK